MWGVLFGWGVLGTVIAVLIGVGFSLMSTTPPEFEAARWCFHGATFLLLLKTGGWLLTQQSAWILKVVAFLLFGIIGAAWLGSVQWVQNRAAAREFVRELQERDPSLVIEPEDWILHSAADYKFNFTLYNAGTSDVERVEVYEDYYNLIGVRPLQFETAGPLIYKPNSIIDALRSKDRASFSIDFTSAWPAFAQRWDDPNAQPKRCIARIKLRYRRSFDGAIFTMAKVMTVARPRILIAGSEREMPTPPPDFPPIPSAYEIETALGGTEQKREK